MRQSPSPIIKSVAIIGGGWSGLACALSLGQAGLSPIIFESARQAGGRARKAFIENTWRDNGQHLMLSGCHALSTFFTEARVFLPKQPFEYRSNTRKLRVYPFGGRAGLLISLFSARGFSWHEKTRMISALLSLITAKWIVPEVQTVNDWLRQTKQPRSLIQDFWQPLALAILNTPLEFASMQRLANVLKETLGYGGKALQLFQPNTNISNSIVQPIVDTIKDLGGSIRYGHRVDRIDFNGGLYKLVIKGQEMLTEDFDAVVLTIPPWSLRHIHLPKNIDLKQITDSFSSEPIATVYLGFSPSFKLEAPLLLIEGPTDNDAQVWALDRANCGEPGVIAVAISAKGPWCHLNQTELAIACLNSLNKTVKDLPSCLWHKTVSVKHATYSATPKANIPAENLEPIPRFYLSGDWTHSDYPATLEAAVASGFSTAKKILETNP